MKRCSFNAGLRSLYVAIGEPGVIDVFDTAPLRRHETIPTERGAHTLSLDAARHLICAFLPASIVPRSTRSGHNRVAVDRPRQLTATMRRTF